MLNIFVICSVFLLLSVLRHDFRVILFFLYLLHHSHRVTLSDVCVCEIVYVNREHHF